MRGAIREMREVIRAFARFGASGGRPPDARRRRPLDGRRLLRRLAPSGWALPSALYKI